MIGEIIPELLFIGFVMLIGTFWAILIQPWLDYKKHI
jgi:hypothetical protein